MPGQKSRPFSAAAMIAALMLASRASAELPAQSPAAPTRPDIVLIIVDDLGVHDLSFYGRTQWATPNLDRLFSEGERFDNAYAGAPVCTPTRASIMTGRSPARLGMTNWTPGPAALGWLVNMPLTEPPIRDELPESETTIAEALQSSGYRTAMVGKWHLGTGRNTPDRHGFAERFQLADGNLPNLPTDRDYFAFDAEGRHSPGTRSTNPYVDDLLTDRFLASLDRPDPQPYFGVYSTHLVHTPRVAPLPAVNAMRARGLGDVGPESATYAAMVEHLDRNIGRLMVALEARAVKRKVVVIFVSDNGGETYETSNAPLSGGKSTLSEGGIRVPFAVWRPGTTTDTTRQDPVITMDIYPTILALAGEPPMPDQHLDGISLSDVATSSSRALYWHYPHYGPHMTSIPGAAIREGDWKLVRYFGTGQLALFNLRYDPSETLNLAYRAPHRTHRLDAMLNEWLRRTEAALPIANPQHQRDAISLYKRRPFWLGDYFDDARTETMSDDDPDQAQDPLM